MSWKIYSIFITDPGKISINTNLLESLGIIGYKHKEETILDFGPKKGDLYIGLYKNNLIISNPDLNFQFFKKEQTEVQKRILNAFPNSEITVLTTGYIYAYAVFKNKTLLRLKEGGDEVYQDVGKDLPEELKLQKMDLIDPADLEFMKEEMTADEINAEIKALVSGETVFELTARYLGVRIDSPDIDYTEIKGIKFENIQAKQENKYPEIENVQFIK